ncbi:hypothetical protein [Alcaligenes faecalis]|uniref:hypothetical protein n=1 Tax=Alcaligenes faecalis TaxID=511 RepID=UPI0006C572D7|nr:hypothetical protein [Alcaligenes faecalis]MCX5593565.1 hypothetical protein [Alcaligenes faecalis]QQC31399.1 hypothetical protein I6H81_12100 [Alcaligenes faecalis]CAJ0905711.1 DUF4760 domain-containing protein [Alcaligenes faecalis subsp. faecalis]CUI43448.1 Uncharacterised protein [Alcaligenes faecalis]GAU71908.1 hypothetical protein AFA2_00218 [Alcaligenes faecalis subsp. faecalis NBRC 13111]
MENRDELPCWALLCIIVGLVFAGIFVWQFPDDSAAWASWIQAFGTIGAVAAAIYVVHLGNKKARKLADDLAYEQAKKDEVAILRALNAELEVEWSRYLEMGGGLLEEHNEEDAFDMFWMPPNPRFPIFQSLAHRVGVIGDPDLVNHLIRTYSLFGRLFVNFETNNSEMINLRASNLSVLQGVKGVERLLRDDFEHFKRMSPILIRSHLNTKAAVAGAQRLIQSRVNSLITQAIDA